MISIKEDGIWISPKQEQDAAEGDWVKYQPTHIGNSKEITVHADSTTSLFKTYTPITEGDTIVINGGIARKDLVGPVTKTDPTDINSTTTTYDSITAYLGQQEGNVRGGCFNKEGNKFLVVGSNIKIYQ